MISIKILDHGGRRRLLLTPEGGPYGRTMGEFPEICNEEATIVLFLAGDADTVWGERDGLSF